MSPPRLMAVPSHSPVTTTAFLKALDPSADCFTFQLFRDPKHRKLEPNPPGLGLVQHCGCEEASALARQWNTPEWGFGFYVTINETNLAGRRRDNIVRVRAVFVDADEDLPGVVSRLRGLFTPNSAVCDEYGSDHTQLLTVLNAAGETPGPTRYLVIRNKPGTPDFVYNSSPDGIFPGVPAEDRDGNPHDFTASAGLAGAQTIDLVGQGQFDTVLSTAHLGILNSPDARNAALRFLTSLPGRADQEGED
jgi:hypothetical protein